VAGECINIYPLPSLLSSLTSIKNKAGSSREPPTRCSELTLQYLFTCDLPKEENISHNGHSNRRSPIDEAIYPVDDQNFHRQGPAVGIGRLLMFALLMIPL